MDHVRRKSPRSGGRRLNLLMAQRSLQALGSLQSLNARVLLCNTFQAGSAKLSAIVPLSKQIVGLSVRIGDEDGRNDSVQCRRKCELVESITWGRPDATNRRRRRGPIRALEAASPDLAKRRGKRFWQSCREKAESGVWRPPHQTPDFFCSLLPCGYENKMGRNIRGADF
jgi:hypothetical protein